MEPRLHFEARSSWEDSATFAIVHGGEYDGTLAVSVSEEQAVDSYNQTFECTLHLEPAQIAELRDWLNHHYPK